MPARRIERSGRQLHPISAPDSAEEGAQSPQWRGTGVLVGVTHLTAIQECWRAACRAAQPAGSGL